MIGGISVRRIPSPTFKLKIETNLDADGNCTRSGCTRRSPCGGILEDLVVASTRMPREEVVTDQRIGGGEGDATRDPRERRPCRRFPGRSQDHRDAQPPVPCALHGCRVAVRVGPVRGARIRGWRGPALTAGSIYRVGLLGRLRPQDGHHRAAPALAGTGDRPPRFQVAQRPAKQQPRGQDDGLWYISRAAGPHAKLLGFCHAN
ncbi:hypothetical protein ON010_g16640 [Phytophthora cinnamomi]|nr:hypothetical protein ON010_g16640 [Phytophthora cinnamomi]